MKSYFEELDERRKVQRAEVDDPAQYCSPLMAHIRSFIEKHRPELPSALVLQLRHAENKALDLLRWHHRPLKSYQWHKRYDM